MSMQDPIADMFTRIRNGQMAEKVSVSMPASKIKLAIAEVLKAEGYIENFRQTEENNKPTMEIALKYFSGKPVIEKIKRISRPGLRVYKGQDELPQVSGGLGVAIVSTSKGVMTARAARAANLGGEVIAELM
jgi:small subunit ribosomal protein S8